MKISAEDGIIVCSLENKIEGFLTAMGAYGCFKGFRNGKLKIHIPFWDGVSQRDLYVDEFEVRVIGKILYYAEKFCVDVDSAVFERLDNLQGILAGAHRLAQEKETAQKRVEMWKDKCVNGCGRCEHKQRDGDDQLCAVSGDLLDEKLKPRYINGVHYMFNYEAFPSENCPYKTE